VFLGCATSSACFSSLRLVLSYISHKEKREIRERKRERKRKR
jgi:hypothetical protein